MIRLSTVTYFLFFMAVPAGQVSAQSASFTPLGDLPGGQNQSYGFGISSDGMTVTGQSASSSGTEAFLWTPNNGMIGLGSLFGMYSRGNAISANGSVIVGESGTAFRWTSGGGMISLGAIPSYPASSASGVSADGNTIVGTSNGTLFPNSIYQAFRWQNGIGMVGLGSLNGSDHNSFAWGVSADGNRVVGYSNSANSSEEAFLWTPGAGMIGLGDLPGGSFISRAYGISANGSVIVGESNSSIGFQAFRWTSGEGMVAIPGMSNATATSADGSVIVGTSTSGGAAIWDAIHGTRDVRQLLVDQGLSNDLTNWVLVDVNSVSADGLTLVGDGTYASQSDVHSEGWVAHIAVPEPSTMNLLAGLFFFCAAITMWRHKVHSRCLNRTM